MQQGNETRRVEGAFIDQKFHHLRVAVLLHHKNAVVGVNELRHLVGKGKGADAHDVEVDAIPLQLGHRLVHGRRGGAEIEHAIRRLLFRVAPLRLRQDGLRRLQLAQQTLHIVDVIGPLFAIFGIAVARGAAGKEAAFGRVRAGQGAERNGIAIHVQIAAEHRAFLQFFRGHDLAAVVAAGVIPGKRFGQPVVHPDVEVHHHEHRRLQPFGKVKGIRREAEGFVRVLREQQHMLGVAVARIGTGENIRLLGACRHAGRWPAALDVEDHRRYLGKVSQAEKFLHQ